MTEKFENNCIPGSQSPPASGSLEAVRDMLNLEEEKRLFPCAAKSADGLRRKKEYRDGAKTKGEYRQEFARDADRILHSLAYTRYIDKTQVFYLTPHDHITHRVLHVQFVSKIARTIGRFLHANEDLIEAVATGHDIGHAPFGHDGETFLSDLCVAHGIGHFYHSVQSVHFLDQVERKGRGWNLCLQTLDGILCHDGETHNQKLVPVQNKDFSSLDAEIFQKKAAPGAALVPMTLEGCIVRMADTISYIGRDIEDAIRLSMIGRDDIPKDCRDILGSTNGTIVYSLVTDLIHNSTGKDYVSFSRPVSWALKKLKAFNLREIYMNPAIKVHTPRIKELFAMLFDTLLQDLVQEKKDSVIYTGFLEGMAEEYMEKHQPAEIVRDFIAGMTDQYFIRQAPKAIQKELMKNQYPG